MEYRRLGNSGLQVSTLTLGTATFGGSTEFFKAWGSSDLSEAKRLIDICLEAGLNSFDTADVYSEGLAEEILGKALEGKRSQVVIGTKATFPTGSGPNDYGSSRAHLIKACEASLRRLRTDYIDIFYMHGFDALTSVEETLQTLDRLIQDGKLRYIACSNFSGWQLMKSLSISERHSWSRYVAHQNYYSLVGRELEWELIPLHKDQNIGTVVWSPLAGGALTGKMKRGQKKPLDSRLAKIDFIPFDSEHLFRIVDVLEKISSEIGKSISQIALNWLLERPSVSSIVIGARTETQLKENLKAVGWRLSSEHLLNLDEVSKTIPIYPYWHQRLFPQLGHLPL